MDNPDDTLVCAVRVDHHTGIFKNIAQCAHEISTTFFASVAEMVSGNSTGRG